MVGVKTLTIGFLGELALIDSLYNITRRRAGRGDRMANWAKIKIGYLEGKKPIELAKKYKVKAQTISNKAYEEDWKVEKSKIQEEIANNYKTEIDELVSISLPELKKIIEMDTLSITQEGAITTVKTADKINAIKAVLDISGLKSEKKELSGTINTASFAVEIV